MLFARGIQISRFIHSLRAWEFLEYRIPSCVFKAQLKKKRVDLGVVDWLATSLLKNENTLKRYLIVTCTTIISRVSVLDEAPILKMQHFGDSTIDSDFFFQEAYVKFSNCSSEMCQYNNDSKHWIIAIGLGQSKSSELQPLWLPLMSRLLVKG